ncbi:MAG: glycine oxidase ThiO [Actinobacteria bacterium]|nr:glycine oxidase ThiO [Actinomycetota bacterium]
MEAKGAPSPDVIVIGGGAIGLGIAWRATKRGMRVTVLDEHPGRGASWAAAGMLSPVMEAHFGEEATLALNLESNRMYPNFIEELEADAGREAGYRQCGTLAVARDADENSALAEVYRFQRELGLEVTRLKGRECRALEPGLVPSIRGGLLVEGDHQVDNRALVEALLAACGEMHVDVRKDRATGVIVENERVTGVSLEGGERLGGGVVVLAAGCWSAAVGGIPPEFVPPVRPVKGQLMHLLGPAAMPLATRNIRGGDVYVVPRGDGRLVIGATVEEQGFDTTVTAGAVFTLLRETWEILPGVDELELVETVAGLRPGSPDNAPMIGESGLEGLLVATGHYRSGILLAPITAAGIVDLIDSGSTPASIAGFSPQRFRSTEAVS